MFASFFSSKKAFRATLCLSLASAIVPAGLCLLELSRVREQVGAIEDATAEARLASDLVVKIGQSLFTFTTAALDLSDEERRAAIEDTNRHLHALSTSVAAAGKVTRTLLSAEEQEKLSKAIQALSHSWEEVRRGFEEDMSGPERAFHFLRVVDGAQVARDILVKLEASATEAAERAMFASLRHTNDVSLFLLIALALGACVSTTALVGNFRFAAATRKANLDLEAAVAELERRDEALRRQNERFDTALRHMSQGLAMFDRDARLVVTNAQYAEVYGLPPELLQPGTTQRQMLEYRVAAGAYDGGDPEKYVADRIANAQRRQASDSVLKLRNGRIIAVAHRPTADGGWVSTHEDITARKQAEEQIAHMAHHDALTGLPNRVLFREEMGRALSRAQRGEKLAVLCLDLDHFKAVNDALGHPVGDALLQAAADRLRGCVRETDMVARLGGDEFAIIQVAVEQPRHATALAERIIERLGEAFDLDGHQVVIGTSVGISVAPGDADDPDQLLKAADMALYRAKTDGRGTFRFFEPEMDARMQARRALEVDLRQGLPNGEFEVYYQPLVNLETDQVSGFEALLRWNHPKRGRVSPAEFIPLAEEIGLINQIGAWVLKQACHEAMTWPDDVKVAVNLSPAQFRSRTLVLDVVAALGASGLPSRRLELEITETAMMQDTEATLATLHQLRELGVRISMDDFGTGYSSLSYLRRFPFDKIKIDQSFVQDLDNSLAIIRAVTGLSMGLGMSTTAEGVETKAQLERLRLEGCTEVQGYFFSQPRPASEVAGLLASVAGKSRAA